MPFRKHTLLVSGMFALLTMLLTTSPSAAQGSVTPSFGNGQLVLVGEGYGRGERVEITVRAGGARHEFTVAADPRGRFRLDTGLAIPPFSSVQIEARDEQGLTQAAITSAPGSGGEPGVGAPLPDSPVAPKSCPSEDEDPPSAY